MTRNDCSALSTGFMTVSAAAFLASACSSVGSEATPPASSATGARQKTTIVIDFNTLDVGRFAPGFRAALTGGGGAAAWSVQRDGANRVLAQTSTDETDNRFPMCVYDGFTSADVSVTCRFKAIAGTIDQAAGLVVRYADANNYYLVRANALEDNVRLYRVVDGLRQQFAGEKHTVTSGAWHELCLVARGKHFQVFFDGEKLFEADDETFAQAGRVGLWTKADSVTWFDDLLVTELQQ